MPKAHQMTSKVSIFYEQKKLTKSNRVSMPNSPSWRECQAPLFIQNTKPQGLLMNQLSSLVKWAWTELKWMLNWAEQELKLPTHPINSASNLLIQQQPSTCQYVSLLEIMHERLKGCALSCKESQAQELATKQGRAHQNQRELTFRKCTECSTWRSDLPWRHHSFFN